MIARTLEAELRTFAAKAANLAGRLALFVGFAVALGWPVAAEAQRVTLYNLPSGVTYPTGITAGPDGAL